eukprot:scaffold12294_cov105-Skeletonema_dohrnii-CCMP3373.AAC.4
MSDTKQLDTKFGLNQTYKNKRDRGAAGDYFKAEKIALLLTNYREDYKEPMKKAIEILSTSKEGRDLVSKTTVGNNSHIANNMLRVLNHVLHENGDLFQELLKGIGKEIDDMRRNAEQEEAARRGRLLIRS